MVNVIMTSSVLSLRKSRRVGVAVWVATGFLTTLGYAILIRLGVRNLLGYYLLNGLSFLACAYLYEESLAQKIFIFFAIWGLSSFAGSFCAWIASALGVGAWEPGIRCILYLVSYLVFLPLFRRFWAKEIKEMLYLFDMGKPAYAALPASAFILYAALFGPWSGAIDFRKLILMVLFEFFIIFMYYLLASHFHAVYRNLRSEEDLRSIERQSALQRKYYEEVERGIKRQAQLLHDMRHHLVAVAAMAQAGEPEAVGPYIESLLANLGGSGVRRHCENMVANAVIGGYIDIAERKGIAVTADLDLPEDLGIGEYELCTLFGNTIENAIEACERIEPGSEPERGRFITIQCRMLAGRLVIRIENSCHPGTRTDQGQPRSSKGELGGIGLQSVKMVVESHGGNLSLGVKDSVFTFSAVMGLGV